MTATHDDPVPKLNNHWWWRPGWRPGRRFLAWHLTFEGETELHNLATAYQRQLAGLPFLDLIPPQWLHLTTQGVGFVDEITSDELHRIVAAVQIALGQQLALTLTFGDVVLRPEAVVLPAEPAGLVRELKQRIHSALVEVLGHGRVEPLPPSYLPHVSIAYGNRDAAAALVLDRLATSRVGSASVTVRSVPFIEMHRDNQMYIWRQLAAAPLVSNSPEERGTSESAIRTCAYPLTE